MNQVCGSLKMRLSKTKVEQYENCAYSFKLCYILGIEPEVKSPALVRGEEIHQLYEDFYKYDGSVDEIAEKIKKHPLYEKHKVPIKNFINLNKRFGENFRPMVTELTVYDESLNIIGIIDRVDVNGKNVAIIDYKSGKYKSIEYHHFQLGLYTYLFEVNYNQPVTHWGIYYIDYDKLVIEPRKQEEVVNAVKRVQLIRKKIKNEEFDKNPSIPCIWCKYYRTYCTGYGRWEVKNEEAVRLISKRVRDAQKKSGE